jgi:hypothetical protein
MFESLFLKISSALCSIPFLFASVCPAPQPVGSALPSGTAVFETSLATPISSAATSMTLAANLIRGGGTLSGYECFTVDEGTAQAEFICGTASGTAVTNLERGVSPDDGVTQDSDLMFSHRRGASVKITDFPLIQRLRAQNSGEGTYESPLVYASSVGTTTLGLNDQNLASVAYANSLSFGAIPASTETAAGFSELATGLEAASSTSNGGSGARLVLPTSISTSTAPSSGNVIPVTQSNGILSGSFCCNGSTTLSASTTIGGFNPIQSILYASSSAKDFSGPSTVTYNFTIPGGTLGNSRGLHITGIITDYDSGAGNPPTSIRMSYGGTQLFDLQGTTNSSATENLRGSFDMYLFATSTSAQFGTGSYSVADNTDAEVGGYAVAGASAIDSTVDQTLTVSFVQNTNSNITVQGVIVMRI